MSKPSTPPPSSTLESPSELDCQNAQLLHLLQLCFLVGLNAGGLLVPLLFWIMRKDESDYLDENGREVVNWQISMLLYGAVAALLCLVFIGFVILPILWLMQIILPVVGCLEARKGRVYRYPLTIRLLS